MSFLLMVFLTLVCLFVGDYQSLAGLTVAQAALATTAAVALVGLHAFWVSRRVSWPLTRDPTQREALLVRYERGRFIHQIVQIGLYLLALVGLGWGWAVPRFWSYRGDAGLVALPGLELLLLAPFVAGQILTWLFFYDAERAAYRAAHRLLVLDQADPFSQAWLEGRPPEPPSFGGRWSYVLFQTRQKLALVMLFLLLLVLKTEVARLAPSLGHGGMNALALVGLAGVFVAMPYLLRLLLGLKPLPPGVLRDRLMAAMGRLGFRCTDILLWNTRGTMANAMVIGLTPWLRYVVFTDRLIEEFPEDEVEAVFGHEVGHIRHQHMLFYLVFLMGSIGFLNELSDQVVLPALQVLFDGLAYLFPLVVPGWLGETFGPTGRLAPIPAVLLLIGYIFVVFGRMSRSCERQADVYGCRAVSCLDPGCTGHTEETQYPPKGQGLCPTGIRVFIRALEKVADVNGISRDRPGFLQSWQHSTIGKRVRFLWEVLRDPGVEARFQRRLWWAKVGLLGGLTVFLALLLVLHKVGW